MSTINDFGLFLKHERELRGIPLEEIANTTKIHMRFLTALENNDYSEFPGEVFIKGYIRSYAKSIGTNVDNILSAYEESVGKQRMETLEKTKTAQEQAVMKKAALKRNVLFGIFLLGFALVGYFVNDIYVAASKSGLMKKGETQATDPNKVSESASDLPADMAVRPDTGDLSPGMNVPELETAPESAGSGNPVVGGLEAGKNPAPPAVTADLQPTPAKIATNTKVMSEEKKPVTADETKNPAVSAKKETAGEEKDPLQLHIKATANSWFNVTVDDGRKMDFILSAGASKSLAGKKSFKVTIGNKSGAELTLNGHSLPLPESEDNVVRDFQITPKLIE